MKKCSFEDKRSEAGSQLDGGERHGLMPLVQLIKICGMLQGRTHADVFSRRAVRPLPGDDHAAASDLVGAVYDNGVDDDGFLICGVEDGALLIQNTGGVTQIAFRALGNAEIDCCTPASLALANRLRDEARVASDANWFGAYPQWAGLTDGDAIDTERRNKVVARMKEHLDATMPRASDALSDRAPGFLLDLCIALYAIDHEKPFQVETVRTLARALEDSPCKVVAAGSWTGSWRCRTGCQEG